MSDPQWNEDPWTPDATPWTPDDDAAAEQERATSVKELLEHLWCVIVYNDDWHTFDDVILQVQKATGCSLEKASHVAHEIHNQGRAIAYRGEKEECQRVAVILREIALQVEIDEA